MKIFVTGATGFIGRNLAERLVEQKHEVICGGRHLNKLDPLKERVKPVYLDIEDKEAALNLLKKEKPDVVYHSAALVESSNPDKLRRANLDGTKNILDACLAAGVKKVVYVSTIAVVSGNPDVPLTEDLPYKATNPYGESKLEAEKIALDYRKKGLKIAILRPCMVYGEGEPHGLSHLIDGIKRRIIPIFGKGSSKLHLVSVENVVDVMVLCLSKEEAYEGTYFVADKEVLSMKEVLEYIAKILGVTPPIVIPGGIVRFLAGLPFIKKKVSFLLKDRYYSIERLENKLGYTPRISVYDGLKRAVLAHEKRR